MADRVTPSPLVARILDESVSREEKRRAVIEAEVTAFPPEQIGALTHSLRQFIEQYRNNEDYDDIVAVGSALRKYVMNMPVEELRTLHVLFDPTETAPVPFEIELELAKTVLWKLAAAPPETDDTLPELADRLMDRVDSYLRPWMLLRENHAAVAQDASLGLLLLRSRHVPKLLALLRDLTMDWFTELLMRRGRWLRQDLEARLPPQNASRCVRDVRALEEALERQPA